MDSYDIRFWDIKKTGNGTAARYRVRRPGIGGAGPPHQPADRRDHHRDASSASTRGRPRRLSRGARGLDQHGQACAGSERADHHHLLARRRHRRRRRHRGPARNSHPPGGGYGLAGLRERLAIYQELSASSSPPPASRTPEQQGDDQGRDGRHNCDVARHRGATRQDGDHRREGFSWRSARRPPMPGMRAVALVVVAARLRFQVAATTNR